MKGQAMPRRPRAESICVLTLHPGSWLLEIPWVLGSGSWVLDDGSWPWLLAPGLWGPRYHIVVPESQVLCIMSSAHHLSPPTHLVLLSLPAAGPWLRHTPLATAPSEDVLGPPGGCRGHHPTPPHVTTQEARSVAHGR